MIAVKVIGIGYWEGYRLAVEGSNCCMKAGR
jgi:hypothetical protein